MSLLEYDIMKSKEHARERWLVLQPEEQERDREKFLDAILLVVKKQLESGYKRGVRKVRMRLAYFYSCDRLTRDIKMRLLEDGVIIERVLVSRDPVKPWLVIFWRKLAE